MIRSKRYAFGNTTKGMEEEEYQDGSTDTESMADIAAAKINIKKIKKNQQQQGWVMYQRQPDENETDGSDLENFEELVTAPRQIYKQLQKDMEDGSSKTSQRMSGNQRNKRPRPANLGKVTTLVSKRGGAGHNSDDDEHTDDEHLEMTPLEFKQIVREELIARGQCPMALKTYEAHISYKQSKKLPLQNDNSKQESSEDTDCSDIDVTMKDYYAIRHHSMKPYESTKQEHTMMEADQPKKVESSPESEEEDTDEDDSDSVSIKYLPKQDSGESDVEVTMHDYYAIRYESTPKVAPDRAFAIDLGSLTSQALSMKDCNGRPILKPILKPQVMQQYPIDSGKDTHGKLAVSISKDGLMTYDEWKLAHDSNVDLSKILSSTSSKATTAATNSSKKIPIEESEEEFEEEEESCSYAMSSNSASMITECVKAEDVFPNIQTEKKTVRPIIRLIEIDGVQGTVGVVCATRSPTRDDVHGIRFLDSSEMDKTEELSNVSDLKNDVEVREGERNEPATDDEELSELADDNKAISEYKLPEARMTSFDVKPVTTEKMVKLDDVVTLNEFVKDIEDLSESDVCDWSENEATIVRRMSGDFRKVGKNGKTLLDDPKKSPTKSNKQGSRQRKRGKKKHGESSKTKPQ
jgi:hypothetical protein